MCPSYLDGDHAVDKELPTAMVIPVRTARESGASLAGLCSFQGPLEARAPRTGTRGLSKLNSMRLR